MKRIILFVLISAFSTGLYAGRNYDVGSRYYGAKNYTKAREALLKEVIDYPNNGNAYYLLGEIEKSENNFSESETYFRKAVSGQIQRKLLSLAYWNLIVLVEQRNNTGEVIKTCLEFYQRTNDESAKRKVDDIIGKQMWTDNEEAIAIYKAASELKDKGKTEEAKQKFYESLRLDSSFLASRFEIGLILYNAGSYVDASYHFKAVSDKIPYHSAANLILGDIYYTSKSFQSAANALSLAIDFGFLSKQTRYAALIKIAGCYYNLKDYNKAIESAQNALAINKDDRDALMLLSAINIKSEKFDEALSSLNRLNKITPDDPDIIYQIGSIYYKEGKEEQFSSAFENLFNIISKDKSTVPAKYSKAMILLIKHHYNKNNFKRVINVASSITDSAKDYETNLIVARSYYQTKEYQNAIDIFEKLSLSNDDKLNLCRAYYKSSNSIKAKEILAPLIRYNSELKSKALSDQVLSSLAREIQREEQVMSAPRSVQPSAPKETRVQTNTPATSPAPIR